MNKKKPVTIYDIAKAAQVTPGTVSRTINNVGYIKKETRDKIEKVMKEKQFIPNRAARTLRTKKTGLVLLAIPDMDNPFYFDLIKAVQDVVKYNGCSLVLYYTEGKEDEEIKALKMMHENFADGMILINFHFTDEYRIEMQKIHSPLVLSGICDMGIVGGKEDTFELSSVSIVQSEIGRRAAELVFERLDGNRQEKSTRIILRPRVVIRESSVLAMK
jgi:DNA-binding LacI/PurR family transcriptional regulator